MVPSGWKNSKLADVCTIINGRPFKPHEWRETGIPIIRIQNLNGSDVYNYFDGQYSDKVLIKSGQLLFAWSGSKGTSFGPHIWNGPHGLLNYHTWRMNVKDAVDSGYFYQYLKIITTRIESKAHGASALVHTQKGEMEKFPVVLPPLPEQRKIATILGTWDKAISTTERLIDNSRQQKKALMQQLLTSKKRLLNDSGKPFEGEWKEVKLGSVVLNTQLGTSERTKDIKESSVIPLIKMGNLTWGGFSFNKLETIPKSIVDNNLILQHGDFLFNTRNTPDLVGKSAVWKGQLTEVTFDNNINRITFNQSVNTDFICFYLTHGKGKSTVNSLPAGSTSVAAIYWKDLKNIKVSLPVISEQTKIISVLNNADKEIELLEKQLADLKQEKKALMQQLLTGKRRVKIDEAEVA
jgi:type I restriction enzyme S subunit